MGYYNTAGPINSTDPLYQDAVHFSPYLWTCLDIPFSSIFAIVFLACTCLSYNARWEALRSTKNLRRWVLFGVAAGQLDLHVTKLVRDAIQVKHMAFLDGWSSRLYSATQDAVSGLTRVAVLLVLLRTFMCLLRTRLVPAHRKRYQQTKTFFIMSCALMLVIGGFFAGLQYLGVLFNEQGPQGTRIDGLDVRAFDDLVYENQEVFTLALDATFVLLNTIALAHILPVWMTFKEKRVVSLYVFASLAFEILYALRIALIALKFTNYIDPILWNVHQGFAKPIIPEDSDNTIVVLTYVFDTVIYGLLMSVGLWALMLLGRLQPAGAGDATDLSPHEDDYRDEEPQRQPNLPRRLSVADEAGLAQGVPPPYRDEELPVDAQLIDVSEDGAAVPAAQART